MADFIVCVDCGQIETYFQNDLVFEGVRIVSPDEFVCSDCLNLRMDASRHKWVDDNVFSNVSNFNNSDDIQLTFKCV